MESEITFNLTILPTELLQVLGWSQQAAVTLTVPVRCKALCQGGLVIPGVQTSFSSLSRWKPRSLPSPGSTLPPHPGPGC